MLGRLKAMIMIFLLIAGWGDGLRLHAQSGDPAAFEAARREGVDFLYNLDYVSAKARFDEMVRLDPDHPAGYYYLATAKWLSILNSMRRLQTGLYTDDSFFAGSSDEIDPQQEREFRQLVSRSILVSKARLRENSRDIEALYFQGAAYGMLAGFEATVARRFKSALDNAKRGVERHKKVIKLDPNFGDAYLSIGLYDYVIGTLPWLIRYGLKLVKVSGNKRKGLDSIQKALSNSRYGNEDAKVVLITLYRREEENEAALALLDELIAKYPLNYLHRLERAGLLARMGRYCDSYSQFELLLGDERAKSLEDLIRYQFGEALFDGGDRPRAIEQFTAVTSMPEADASLVSLSYLRHGQLMDIAGDHPAAIEQYRVVLSREDVFDSHRNAKRYNEKPYSREMKAPVVCGSSNEIGKEDRKPWRIEQ